MRRLPEEWEWGVVGTALSALGAALAWVWVKVLRPNIIGATRSAFNEEHLLMTSEDRMAANGRADAVLRLEGRVEEHDRALDRLAPMPAAVAQLQAQSTEQTVILREISEKVGYLHGRVSEGTRTFRDARGD